MCACARVCVRVCCRREYKALTDSHSLRHRHPSDASKRKDTGNACTPRHKQTQTPTCAGTDAHAHTCVHRRLFDQHGVGPGLRVGHDARARHRLCAKAAPLACACMGVCECVCEWVGVGKCEGVGANVRVRACYACVRAGDGGGKRKKVKECRIHVSACNGPIIRGRERRVPCDCAL